MINQLSENTSLEIKPQTKFSYTRIEVDFFEEIEGSKTTARSLLSNILSNSSKNYPRRIDNTRKFMDMYGANFSSQNRQCGNLNVLSFSIDVINLKETQKKKELLNDGIKYLEEKVFNPNMVDDSFDDQVYEKERDNLISSLNSLEDDYDYQSNKNLWKLIFSKHPEYATPSVGTISELKKINNKDLFDYYLDVLKTNSTKITVVGDVDDTMITELFKDSKFADNNTDKNNKVALQKQNELVNNEYQEKIDNKNIEQSKLAIGYEVDISLFDNNLPFNLFNVIFGGDDQSRLFLNVRERNGLAYSVSSSFHMFTGIVSVSAGVSADKINLAIDVIDEQIKNMADGDVSDSELNHAKTVLLRRKKINQDSVSSDVNQSIISYLRNKPSLSYDEYEKRLQQIQVKDIVKVAKSMRKIAEYKLVGE